MLALSLLLASQRCLKQGTLKITQANACTAHAHYCLTRTQMTPAVTVYKPEARPPLQHGPQDGGVAALRGQVQQRGP